MSVPYSLVMIKPLSVGRGDAPDILADLLEHCPISLRMFRTWPICDTTLQALTLHQNSFLTGLDYDVEKIHLVKHVDSWMCIFTHLDRQTDPTRIIDEYCGPLNPQVWRKGELRYTFGGYSRFGKTAHASDTVVYIARPERVQLESALVFLDFDDSKV